MDSYQKNVWHKQECDKNECDYKGHLLYLNWMVDIQVLPCSQLIFPSKFTWFLGIYLNFQQPKWLKNQYFPHSESKSYLINSIKSCSSRSFQQHHKKFQFLWNFQLWFDLIFSEKIIQYSRTFCTASSNVMEPSLPRAFQRHQKTPWSEASQFGGSPNHKTNYLPS